jgi:hypothetical protein
VLNFGQSEVLVKKPDEMPLLLAPRDKFVTLNIFGRRFSVDFPTREDWSKDCVDLVAPDEQKLIQIEKYYIPHFTFQ